MTSANFLKPSFLNHSGWAIVYAFGLLLATIALLVLHWDIINAPVALDYYEGQIPMITGVFAAGENPYSYEYQPEHTSVYGIVYNLLMVPIVDLFGNTLEIHRLVNAGFLLSCCGLIALSCWWQSNHLLHSLAAAVLAYSAFLFYSTPLAASNAVGLFLMLLSAIIPWRCRFSTASLLLSALITIAAFYTKIYYVAGGLFVGLYLGSSVSIQRALLYSVFLLSIFLPSVYLMVISSPYYFDNNYFAATNPDGIWLSNKRLYKQLAKFAELYAGVGVLVLICAFLKLRKGSRTHWTEWLNFSFSKPLLATPPNFFWLCFFGGVLIICISLGRNPGNWMSYLFQLMSPFFALAAMTSIARSKIPAAVCMPLVLTSIAAGWHFLPKHFDIDTAPWQRLEALIQQHDSVLSSQALLMPMVKHNKQIFQDGQTFYFPFSSAKPDWARHRKPHMQVERVWADFLTRHYQRVQLQQYDIALLAGWDVNGIFGPVPPQSPDERGDDFFKRYYELTETITIDLGGMPGGGIQHVGVWKPKPKN